jgi:predicted nucleic acid-binding Zn ribbon protein
MSSALSDLLRRWVQDHRLEGELAKARLPRYWADVVGERVATRTEIRSFESGVLRVHVPEAAWRSELSLRREELRTKINRLAGGELVREIIIR